jgi:hypothetical protein
MKPKFNTTDPDLIASYPALKRAAKKARRLSIATGTPFIIWKDGKVVDLNAKKKRPKLGKKGGKKKGTSLITKVEQTNEKD